MNPLGITKNVTAAGIIAKHRIVAHAETEGEVEQAAADTDPICGVTGVHAATAAGKRIDIHKSGLHDIECGDDVVPGDPLTSDDEGRAVKAEPDPGLQVRIIGYAEAGGELGSLCQALIQPGILTAEETPAG